MGKKNGYRQYLKQTLGGVIDQLDLSELRKDFLKNRWLDQLLWLEGRATKERNSHYTLRMITIIGGVIVPALVGFQNGNSRWREMVSWSAFGLSQAVAISAAIEELFGHGENYRNYRNTAEGLKIEGWQFFQMAGPYHQFQTHSDAYPSFAERVELYIQKDVQSFVTQLEKRQEESKQETEETVKGNTEVAAQKLNEQLELQDQFETQLKELEAEKQRVKAQRQQLEQQNSEFLGSDRIQPAKTTAEDSLDQQPDLEIVELNGDDSKTEIDSSPMNGHSLA